MGLALLFFLGQALLGGVPSWASQEAEALCSGTACYTIHWGKYNWVDAQGKCKNNGGNLVTVKNQEEALHIQDLLAKLPRREAGPEGQVRLWIGLHREKGTCYQQHQLLKGFSWVSGGEEESHYSGWLREPRETCTARRCVSLHWNTTAAAGASGLGWADGPCSPSSPAGALGYLCKFSFQGMCRRLVLAGPGNVTYTTPFGVDSASLAAVPFGSLAAVWCEPRGPAQPPPPPAFPVCKEPPAADGAFEWSSPGPFCGRGGCAQGGGGCQHECLELAGGAFRCACRRGYRLGGDRLSCLPLDPCSPSPCRGGECLSQPGGFQCRCPAGYALAGDGLSCLDVDECGAPAAPCEGGCVNTAGGFACTCPAGYEPAEPGGRRCRDVDECAREGDGAGPCAQLCTNAPGSFLCSCRPGWALAPDGFACLFSASGPAGSSAPSLRPGGEEEPEAGGGWAADARPASESPAPRSEPALGTEPGGAERPGTAAGGGSSTLQPAAISRATGAGQHRKPDSDNAPDGPRLLLYYILGTVVVILLLLAFALGLLLYRKRKAQKGKKKSKSATDNYSWVPEQGEKTAVDNEYR